MSRQNCGHDLQVGCSKVQAATSRVLACFSCVFRMFLAFLSFRVYIVLPSDDIFVSELGLALGV